MRRSGSDQKELRDAAVELAGIDMGGWSRRAGQGCRVDWECPLFLQISSPMSFLISAHLYLGRWCLHFSHPPSNPNMGDLLKSTCLGLEQ